jgi:hypothetical protein
MLPSRWIRASLVVVLALVGSMLVLQAPADAAATGKVRGGIYGAHGTTPKVVMQWFTKDWTFLGKRKANGGAYSLSLRPGTYWVQFVDQAPAYDVTKAAPTNVKVTVRAGHTVTKNVRMRPGAAITGTVRAGGKPAGGARIVAANTAEQSFEVKANNKGQFALGGLPAGNYSVFTYDRTKKFVGKSLWVPGMKPGKVSNVGIKLTKPAGRLLVDLYAGSEPVKNKVTVTVVSKKNGQFWTANAKHGSVSFQGLFPGKYKIVTPGVGNYFASTGPVSGGKVRPNKVAFGSYRLTKRGGWVSGKIVDNADPEKASRGIANAQVTLRTSSNEIIASTTTDANGLFTLDGQLATQSGLKVVATPQNGPNSWAQGQMWCLFTSGSEAPVKVTTGKKTAVGEIAMKRSTASSQPDTCRVS